MKNDFLKSSKLYAPPSMICLFELTMQKFVTLKRLKDTFVDFLQRLLGDRCYISYSKRVWNVSQWTKNHYANQGDRALNFFDSSLRHDKKGLIRVVRDSQS